MENESSDCILHMFVRPNEPLFMPRGKDKVVFCLPEGHRSKRYEPIAEEVTKHFEHEENRKIHVDRIDCTDLRFTLKLKRDDQFSVFIPEHNKIAGRLIGIFMDKKTYKEFESAAAYCRDRVNPSLFNYALSVAILHRPDTKDLTLPGLCGVFPHLFIDGVTLNRAKQEVNSVPEHCRRSIKIKKDHTATDMDIEHRVAYFREDLGVNLHHHHWHLIYPTEVTKYTKIVDKDRRGELFYYMHQQILARYNFERLSNRLARVKSLNSWREPIPEGYFSKLGADSSTTFYPGRQSGAILRDVDREDYSRFEIQDLERHRDRIIEAIHRRAVIGADGESIKLDEVTGIDILGNVVEATVLSPNRTFYGNLHNNGHIAIASCHDPDNRHLESFGVMGTNPTAMRDPIFYRWHAFIDDIYQEHKDLLSPYKTEELEYKGLKIKKVVVKTPHGNPTSKFYTHWQESEVDISNGLDFQSSGFISVCFTHLNHQPFAYEITVNNYTDAPMMGTVRIFMAPRHDERGYNFAFNIQRKLMIELDKFVVELPANECSTINRRSDESSLTIPFEQTFPPIDGKIGDRASLRSSYCNCGWPQHMLIPKGTKDGLAVDLFVMVSNYGDDMVDQELKSCCKTAASFCGLKDEKYPDARAMGFPFDRPLATGVDKFEKFMTDNMCLKEMNIVFTDETKEIRRDQ